MAGPQFAWGEVSSAADYATRAECVKALGGASWLLAASRASVRTDHVTLVFEAIDDDSFSSARSSGRKVIR